MKNTLKKKIFTSVAIAGIAAIGLVGCSDTEETDNEPITQTEETTEETPESEDPTAGNTAENDDENLENTDPDAPVSDDGSVSADSVPTAVSGYTSDAESDLAEENISQDEVDEVLTNPDNVERDDDGWEIKKGDVKIDIRPDGTVYEADRDN